jgi:hypothetical protein
VPEIHAPGTDHAASSVTRDSVQTVTTRPGRTVDLVLQGASYSGGGVVYDSCTVIGSGHLASVPVRASAPAAAASTSGGAQWGPPS